MEVSPLYLVLSDDPLEAKILEQYEWSRRWAESAGGVVTFTGQIRGAHGEKFLRHIEYTAYVEMFYAEGRLLLEEIQSAYGLAYVSVIHRKGHLVPGEVPVHLAAGAHGRDDAFLGCRALLEGIKTRLPIWKKEVYTDGSHAWIQ